MFEIAIGILLGVLGFIVLRFAFSDVLEIENDEKYEDTYKIPGRFRNPAGDSSS